MSDSRSLGPRGVADLPPDYLGPLSSPAGEGTRGHPSPDYSMVCIDFDPVDLQIVPCPHCPRWWAEVTRDDSGAVVVREWHMASCTEWSDDPLPAELVRAG